MKWDKRFLLLCVLACGCVLSGRAWALEPDEIFLVCNPRVAASPELAMLYAKSRNVPLKNIFELPLPDGEQLAMDRFDPDVVMPIRNAITNRGLKDKIKCILTFYGVPLRLSPRTARPDETRELASLQTQLDDTQKAITAAVTSLEGIVIKHDEKFRPAAAIDIVGMLKRAEVATNRGQEILNGQVNESGKKEIASAIMNTIAALGGEAGLLRHTKPAMLTSLTTRPATTQISDPQAYWTRMEREVAAANKAATELASKRHDPASRQKLRDLTTQHFGLVDTLRILSMQADYLTPDGTNSFDSELSLLWVDNYNRKNFVENPLHYRSKQRKTAPIMMVARLDGPESGTAHQILLASKAAETKGLTGRFAIDLRGLPPTTQQSIPDNYGEYDQRLRELAGFVQRNTKMPVVVEDSPGLFRAESKQKDVALYAGWYSVRNYVPGMEFVPGAVGFHIGSFELVSLRNPQEKGWVRGMLNDGIAASLGPVDEPYLLAFPDPMDFFPLLLTGRYTLAEVYWMSSVTTSWRMCLIGDPLYNPFKANPQLKVEDLPPDLRRFVEPPQQYELPKAPGLF